MSKDAYRYLDIVANAGGFRVATTHDFVPAAAFGTSAVFTQAYHPPTGLHGALGWPRATGASTTRLRVASLYGSHQVARAQPFILEPLLHGTLLVREDAVNLIIGRCRP